MKNSFELKCSSCGKIMIYKSQLYYQKALNENRLCRSCREIKTGLIRHCPKCNCEITYKRTSDYKYAIRYNTFCCSCSINSGKFQKGVRNFDYNDNQSTIPSCNLERLYDKSLQSFYWLGVILSDGSFYKTRFELSFKELDSNFLKSFSQYFSIDESIIKYRKSSKSYRLQFGNRVSNPKIMSYFDIKYRKTYNPPDFQFYQLYTQEQLTALLIGIIDGDGCISTSGSISITSHKSWESFFRKLLIKLNFPIRISFPKNKNVLKIGIYQNYYKQYLKNFIINNNLFTLDRKWSRIK